MLVSCPSKKPYVCIPSADRSTINDAHYYDLAIAYDPANDTLAILAINPNGGDDIRAFYETLILRDVTSINIPESIFGVDDEEATAYGLATYTSPIDGKTYVFVSQSDGNKIAQLELQPTLGAADALEVNAQVVRTFEIPVPEGVDLEDAPVEEMVVDRETGYLYVAQEQFGIWKYDAEPDGDNEGKIVDTVTEIIAQEVVDVLPSGVGQFAGETPLLVPDVEGLTIYYGEDGNNTFAIYDHNDTVNVSEGNNRIYGDGTEFFPFLISL